MVWPQAPPVGEGCSLRFFDSQYDVGHFPIQLLLPQSRLTLQGLTLLRRCVLWCSIQNLSTVPATPGGRCWHLLAGL